MFTALPRKDVPAAARTRGHGHGRDEIRTLKTAHVEGLDLPHARQAIKIIQWRQDSTTQKSSREIVYTVADLVSAQATPADLARLVRGHWGIEVIHHVRDVSFSEDQATSRTSHGPINLAAIAARASTRSPAPATFTSPKAAATTPPPMKPSASTASHD